jgi:hypothetical protein
LNKDGLEFAQAQFLLADLLLQRLVLAVQFLHCGGGINRERIGVDLQDGRAIALASEVV